MAGLRTGQKLIVKTVRKIKMENQPTYNEIEISGSEAQQKLADNWKWNPWLINDVTLIISRSIGSSQTIQEKDFHSLAWSTPTGETDVIVEVRDGNQSLLINLDIWRPHREQLALEGLAARYSLVYSEFSEENQ